MLRKFVIIYHDIKTRNSSASRLLYVHRYANTRRTRLSLIYLGKCTPTLVHPFLFQRKHHVTSANTGMRTPKDAEMRANGFHQKDGIDRFRMHDQTTTKISIDRCYNCGTAGHRASSCRHPTGTKVCYKCYKSGHIAADCPSDGILRNECD